MHEHTIIKCSDG